MFLRPSGSKRQSRAQNTPGGLTEPAFRPPLTPPNLGGEEVTLRADYPQQSNLAPSASEEAVPRTPVPPKKENTMKKQRIIELAVKVLVAALTAFLTALGTTSCMQ